MWPLALVLMSLAGDVPRTDAPWFVDDGDLVVAWGDAVDPAWLGPAEAPRRPTRRLVSSVRALDTAKLPEAMSGLVGQTLSLWTADGERCEARVTGLRARCLGFDDGAMNDAAVCVPQSLDGPTLCERGQVYVLGALAPVRAGERLCAARVATTAERPLAVWSRAAADAEADARLLAAFRATRAWREQQEQYAARDEDAVGGPAPTPWDSFGRHRPTVRRFLPPAGASAELAYVWSDLSTDADGGAPNESLVVVFQRPVGTEAWQVHRQWMPTAWPAPEGFYTVGAPRLGALVALGPASRFTVPPGSARSLDDEETVAIQTERYTIPSLSDPQCEPR